MRDAREEGQVILIEANWNYPHCTTFCIGDIAAHYPWVIRKAAGSSACREFGMSSTSQGFDCNENPDFNS